MSTIEIADIRSIETGKMFIPTTWHFDRIKNIGSVNGRVGWKALKASEYVEEGYFFLSTPNIKGRDIDYVNVNYITKERYRESPEIMLRENDILLTKDGSTLGTVNIVQGLPSSGTVNSSIAVLRFKKGYVNKYFFWLIKSDFVQNVIQLKKDGMGVPHLFQKDINNFLLLIPPYEEQKVIASFLDKKTLAIDKKIFLLEAKIDYYHELSKSLINETVCKGLNKKVPLKESGIEWIGEISKHWQVKRLKDVGYLYSGLSGKTGEHFNQEVNGNSKYYIPFTNIANNKYIDHEDLHRVIMDDNEKQNRVKKNDLFFLMSSEGFADIGKSALLVEDVKETYLNSFCKGYRITKKNVVPKYLNYLLNSPAFRDKFIVQGKGFTRINLKMEKVSDFEFLIPPVQEQKAIADFLDNKTKTIDAIVVNIKLQIDNLKDLRKTLINDAVTGKLKVTE